MDLPLTLLDLAGAIALLLWGVRMVQTGIQRAFGGQLKIWLARALGSRLRALLAGVGVTAILQSSTATGLMVTGFAARGLVGLIPALAVMLGANIGTTLIVQVLSFDVVRVAPVLILIGFLMFQRASAGRRDFGRVFIGLGLMLMSLHQLVSLMQPYENAASVRGFLDAVATQPVLYVVLGAVLAWAVHSSVAIVLLAMSFASHGAIPLDTALAFVLGANLGTAINPVLEGVGGRNPAAWRVPIGNLLNRLAGVAVALLVLPWTVALLTWLEPGPARAVADYHTAFNLVLALVFLPALGPYAALLRRWLPAREDPNDARTPRYLDPAARETPTVALDNAARETVRMAQTLSRMLQGFCTALLHPSRHQISLIRQADDTIDSLNAAIKSYVVSLDADALGETEREQAGRILAFATNVEQAADIVDRNLLGMSAKMLKRGISFSPEGRAELLGLTERLLTNVELAIEVFGQPEMVHARRLAQEKQVFRARERRATAAHFARLRRGVVQSAETSAIHLDVLRDLKQVNAHLVAGAAYPVLEAHRALLPHRVEEGGDEL
ncbi:Na/Pi cotransporter family protein [Verticiella sediminum]|uniref:Na/Pi cotransporter family protein n=1 Tax=Verticiella sediminum TaxID=1247510 RepID=A0A556AVH6_9BURK|nr:Na/Pi cotransporter family protein [Verticiella sediminum]TSH96936.1 Na/Pi cotransporter family protein [Verticiella sediminum]